MSLQDEPVAIVTAGVAVIESTLAALVTFGFDLSPEQVAGILGVANAVGALITIAIARQMAFAPSTVKEDYVPKYTTPEEVYGSSDESPVNTWANFQAARTERQPTRVRFEDGDLVGEFNIRSKEPTKKSANLKMREVT